MRVQKLPSRGIYILCYVLAILSPQVLGQIYVLPNGLDSNTGTREEPVQTITKHQLRPLARSPFLSGEGCCHFWTKCQTLHFLHFLAMIAAVELISASSSSTIFLLDGNYNFAAPQLIQGLSKSITIASESMNPSMVSIQAPSDVLIIQNTPKEHSITFDSISITSSGTRNPCLWVPDTGNLTILNSVLVSLDAGTPWEFNNTDATILGCTMKTSAPGIIWSDSNVIIKDSTFSECSNTLAMANGGALFAHSASSIFISNSSFINCTADYGGVMLVEHSPLTIEDSSFVSSTATFGGTILATGAQVTIRRSRFWESMASNTGGAIYLNDNANMYAEDVSFEDCHAKGAGCIAAMVASVHLNRVVVSNTQVQTSGGFLYATERDVVIENSSFDSTIALLGAGGAFYLQNMNNVLLRNISVSRSFAWQGGSIFLTSISNVTIPQAFFNRSASIDPGGAIYTESCNVKMSDVRFKGCFTNSGGGSLSSVSSNVEMARVRFEDSQAELSGGAAAFTGSDVEMNDVTVTNGFSPFASGFDVLQSIAIMDYVNFINNTAESGGAMRLRDSAAFLDGGFFFNNFANSSSGALSVTNSTFFLHHTRFERNAAAASALAVNNLGGQAFEAYNCTFVDNHVTGGIATMYPGTRWTFEKSTFERNVAIVGPAGLLLFEQGNITNCKFLNNLAGYQGAAILIQIDGVGAVRISNSEFTDNQVLVENVEEPGTVGKMPFGGAIASGASPSDSIELFINSCNFTGNSVVSTLLNGPASLETRGGAIGIDSFPESFTLDVKDTIFTDNYVHSTTLASGGALYCKGCKLSMHNVEMLRNNATSERSIASDDIWSVAGAAYITFSTIDFEDMKVSYSHAYRYAGIYFLYVNGSMRNSEFIGNHVDDICGATMINNNAVDYRSSPIRFINVRWESNSAVGPADSPPGGFLGFSFPCICYAHAEVTLDDCQFINNEIYPSDIFGADVLCLLNANLTIASSSGSGSLKNGPGLILAGECYADMRGSGIVDVEVPVLKLWGDDSISGLFLDHQTINVTGYSILKSGMIISNERAAIVHNSDVDIIRGPKLLTNLDITFKEVAKIDGEVILDMQNTVINVEGIFAPMSFKQSWIKDSFGQSELRFGGRSILTLTSLGFEGVDVIGMGNATVAILASNYWQPSGLHIGRNSSLVVPRDLLVSFDYVRNYAEPTPFQIMTVVNSTFSPLVGQFGKSEYLGGYRFLTYSSQNEIEIMISQFTPISSSLNSAATYVVVKFPRETNKAGDKSSCSSILTAASLQLFSNDVHCSYSDAKELRISASYIPLGSDITFINGSIADVNPIWSNFTVAGETVTISAPRDPISPTAALNCPTISSECGAVLLDATASYGGGVFPLSYNWTLESPEVLAIASHISSNSSTVIIPAHLFPPSLVPTQYSFKLTVSSIFGKSSTTTCMITRAAVAVPDIILEGPSERLVYASSPLQINARVQYRPECSTSATKMSTTWVQASGPEVKLSTSSGLTQFFPAGTFQPDTTYSFQLLASPHDNTMASGSTTVVIHAIGSPMTLVATGGGSVSSQQGATVKLKLIDPDVSPSPITYIWDAAFCPLRGQASASSQYESLASQLADMVLTGQEGTGTKALTGVTCQYSNGTRYQSNFGNTSAVNFPGGGALLEGSYVFVAAAFKGSRSATTLVYLDVTSATTSGISVDITPATITPKVLSQERLALLGIFNGHNLIPQGLTAQWSILNEPNQDLLGEDNLLTSPQSANLVIKPDVLGPGRLYPFRLVLQSSAVEVGSSVQPIIINTAPTGGNLVIVPSTGTQGSTFSINAFGWVDEDAPLSYLFSVISPEHGEILLADTLDVPFLNAFMPISGINLEIRVSVADRLGTRAVVSAFINVTQSAASGDMSPSRLVELISEAMDFGDLRYASELITALLTQQNEAQATATEYRAAVIDALEQFVSRQPTTLSNTRFIVKSLQLTTVVSDLSASLQLRIVVLLDTLMDKIISDPTSRLLSTFSADSARATRDLLQAIEQLLQSDTFRTSEASSTIGPRILSILKKLIATQSRVVVFGESGPTSEGSKLAITVQKLSIEQLRGGFFAIVNGSVVSFTASEVPLPEGTAVGIIVWGDDSFPIVTPLQHHYTTVITTTLTNGTSSTIELPAGTYVTVEFDSVPMDSSPEACGIFDEQAQTWDSSLCTLTNGPNSASFLCQCSRTGSITLLFDIGLGGGAIAAIVIVSIVVVAALGFALAAYLVPALRAKVFPFLGRGGNASSTRLGDNSVELLQQSSNTAPASTTTAWKEARGSSIENVA